MSEKINEHYDKHGFRTIEFVDLVGLYLQETSGITFEEAYCIKDIVAYCLRAGFKDGEPWQKDARKVADYFHKLLTHEFMPKEVQL